MLKFEVFQENKENEKFVHINPAFIVSVDDAVIAWADDGAKPAVSCLLLIMGTVMVYGKADEIAVIIDRALDHACLTLSVGLAGLEQALLQSIRT